MRHDFDSMYEDLMEHQKNLKEAVDAKKIIDELIDTSFGGSNESQMKAVQLLKGLATSDDPASNAFMKKLDAWTSGLKKSEGHTERHYTILSESIKSELDKLGADTMKRDRKLVTLTWKKDLGASTTKQAIMNALKSFGDKIKHIGTEKSNGGIKAEIEMA